MSTMIPPTFRHLLTSVSLEGDYSKLTYTLLPECSVTVLIGGRRSTGYFHHMTRSIRAEPHVYPHTLYAKRPRLRIWGNSLGDIVHEQNSFDPGMQYEIVYKDNTVQITSGNLTTSYAVGIRLKLEVTCHTISVGETKEQPIGYHLKPKEHVTFQVPSIATLPKHKQLDEVREILKERLALGYCMRTRSADVVIPRYLHTFMVLPISKMGNSVRSFNTPLSGALTGVPFEVEADGTTNFTIIVRKDVRSDDYPSGLSNDSGSSKPRHLVKQVRLRLSLAEPDVTGSSSVESDVRLLENDSSMVQD